MPNLSHEEIVQKFLNSKSVDFNALGKFVAEFGPQIAASGHGDYAVRIGHYNILACVKNIMPNHDLIDVGASGIAAEVVGGGR
jgi:hypothetical protein